MKRNVIVAVGLLLVVAGLAGASTILEFPLNGVVDYDRVIGPDLYQANSQVDVYVENIFNPLRWKDWSIQIWVPQGAADLAVMRVDYDNTPNHSAPIDVFPVNLAPVAGPPPWQGFKGFYASTYEPAWENAGTTPEGSGGPHPWGNPMWVSFHIDVPQGPFGLYIFDECIPEPATLAVLLIGGLLAVLKRSKRSI